MEVGAMTRLSQTTIYRLRRKGKFPSPITLGERRIAYRQSEIETWLEQRSRVKAAPTLGRGGDSEQDARQYPLWEEA
ncbi:hypothetical protein DC522_32610 [Microvirga sp. KLBC 81]|nr:hypothetical protein DC522_32610 [Microvirga sp. KLBC 81]